MSLNCWISSSHVQPSDCILFLLICDRETPLGNQPAQPSPVLLLGTPPWVRSAPLSHSTQQESIFYCVMQLVHVAKDLGLSWGVILSHISQTLHTPTFSQLPVYNTETWRPGLFGVFFFFFFPSFSCKLLKWNKLKFSQGIEVIFIECVISLGM